MQNDEKRLGADAAAVANAGSIDAPERQATAAYSVDMDLRDYFAAKAMKARYSGDANLRDKDGRLCGVKYERIGDGGWYTVGMI